MGLCWFSTVDGLRSYNTRPLKFAIKVQLSALRNTRNRSAAIELPRVAAEPGATRCVPVRECTRPTPSPPKIR